jgi:MORN repeat
MGSNSSCCKKSETDAGVTLQKALEKDDEKPNQAASEINFGKISTKGKTLKRASLVCENMDQEGLEESPMKAQQIHAPSPNIAVPIDEMPDVENPGIEKIVKEIGEFRFELDELEDKSLPFLQPYKLENGIIYQGQWKHGERHGRGVHVWPNNSIYYGYWKNGMANGFGRLIHSDGDVYEGEWKNNKAHGEGDYYHYDGAVYRGCWRDDSSPRLK